MMFDVSDVFATLAFHRLIHSLLITNGFPKERRMLD